MYIGGSRSWNCKFPGSRNIHVISIVFNERDNRFVVLLINLFGSSHMFRLLTDVTFPWTKFRVFVLLTSDYISQKEKYFYSSVIRTYVLHRESAESKVHVWKAAEQHRAWKAAVRPYMPSWVPYPPTTSTESKGLILFTFSRTDATWSKENECSVLTCFVRWAIP